MVKVQVNLFTFNFRMERFLKTIFFFIAVTLFIILCLIILLYVISKPEKATNNESLFIWGDSQTYQGIDITRLQENTGLHIYSAATHGAGVYDFLIFAEQVPDSSICIVGYSQLCLLRKKEKDYNESGVSFNALKILTQNNYSLREIQKILTNNKFMRKYIFKHSSMLYNYCDTIVTPEPIQLFEQMYKSIPPFYLDKYSIYLSGIHELIKKNCTIIFIAFPYYSELANIYETSIYKNKLDDGISFIANEYTCKIIDTTYILDSDSLLMHDLTHFNEIGARRTSDLIGNYLDSIEHSTKNNRFLLINNWSCN